MDNRVCRGPSVDEAESVNLPDFAHQKNAGQSLGASGSDRQRECKFVAQYNPAPLRWDRGMCLKGAAASSGHTV